MYVTVPTQVRLASVVRASGALIPKSATLTTPWRSGSEETGAGRAGRGHGTTHAAVEEEVGRLQVPVHDLAVLMEVAEGKKDLFRDGGQHPVVAKAAHGLVQVEQAPCVHVLQRKAKPAVAKEAAVEAHHMGVCHVLQGGHLAHDHLALRLRALGGDGLARRVRGAASWGGRPRRHGAGPGGQRTLIATMRPVAQWR